MTAVHQAAKLPALVNLFYTGVGESRFIVVCMGGKKQNKKNAGYDSYNISSNSKECHNAIVNLFLPTSVVKRKKTNNTAKLRNNSQRLELSGTLISEQNCV